MSAASEPVLRIEGLTKHFHSRAGGLFGRPPSPTVEALTDVSFSVHRGEVIGIVGESGCGKTTLARTLLRLLSATSGSIFFEGKDILTLDERGVKEVVRPNLRMVFQHPDAILNPGYPIGKALSKPMLLHGADPKMVDLRVADLLIQVGLDPDFASKYPNELSGGEKRRVGICRALATDPSVIVADEPLSGLDVLLQERILRVFLAAQEAAGFALLLISHDLERVNQVCDRVLVMYAGRVVEEIRTRDDGAPKHEQFAHPYSRVLQAARVGIADGGVGGGSLVRDQERGVARDGGCAFRPECARWVEMGEPESCSAGIPEMHEIASDHRVRCPYTQTT